MFTAELFIVDKIWNQAVSIGGRADKRNMAHKGLHPPKPRPRAQSSRDCRRKATDTDHRHLMVSKRQSTAIKKKKPAV